MSEVTPEIKAPGDNFDIVVMKFADSKIPEFRELPNKDYISCGAKNDYAEYCLYQYNKCGKHKAIINAKTKYILGMGLEGSGPLVDVVNPDGSITKAKTLNSDNETMYDLLKKSIRDVEIHGGFRWFITYDQSGKISSIEHSDFYKFRTAKPKELKNKDGNVIGYCDRGYWWKEKWFNENGNPTHRIEPDFFPEFDPTKKEGCQVFAYNEYGPGSDWYPLPEYTGCANYIDIDIEVSKFHLSSIVNGMMPSKLIQFYTGEPSEDKKKEIEGRFKKKFAGSENAGKFILVFNASKDKTVDISDLSFSELDKQFDLLSKTVQQEIFTGHQVVSPMLFGVKTEGQLGGTNELKIAYEIFINTYAKPKQNDYERVVNYFSEMMGLGNNYEFKQLDPVGVIIDINNVLDKIPVEYILERVGVPEKYITPQVKQQTPSATGPTVVQNSDVNENVKNLTAKQHQQLLRILRQYDKKQLTKERASLMLSVGLGLSQDHIDKLLSDEGDSEDMNEVQKFEKEIEDEDNKIVEMFSSCGDPRSDFHIVKSKAVAYSKQSEMVEDELTIYKNISFGSSLTKTEASIVDLIKKDKLVTPEVIAKTIGTNADYVAGKIASLVKSGVIKTSEVKVGDDVQIEREVSKSLKDLGAPPKGEIETAEILVRYSYEGPKDNRNRPFCAKMLSLDRLYSRAEIERISDRLGYSVFERRGGWYTKPDGTRQPYCRHRWKSNIVVKKK